MSEEKLILALKHGSETAFEEIYLLYWHRVFHFASLYINNKEEVKEIVQEVFIKLWESKRFLQEGKDLKSYLFIITRNHVFNKSRSNYFNSGFYQQTIDNALEYSYCIETDLEAKELEGLIEQLICEMPKQRQKIFTLSRKEHKKYKEIASILGISEKTVERHINEAIKYIKKKLNS
ncbi:MAG: RNA polymerase sigma-70 factor [Dysgonamonadaceae bacterium]